MLSREEAMMLLKTCVTSILSRPNFEAAVRFVDFRKALSERTLRADDGDVGAVAQAPYFFVRTTLSALLSLIKTSVGAAQEHALGNLSVLLPLLWEKLRQQEKRGTALSAANRLLDAIMGGWQVNGIVAFRSGVRYTLGVSGDIANTGNSNNAGYYERLNVVGDPNASDHSVSRWFNTSAFTVPAQFTYGNPGRNTMRADWGRNLDASVFRKFPIGERIRLEFRAEAFNLTNTPVYGAPVSNFSSPNFGRVLQVANTPRQLQFGLKLTF